METLGRDLLQAVFGTEPHYLPVKRPKKADETVSNDISIEETDEEEPSSQEENEYELNEFFVKGTDEEDARANRQLRRYFKTQKKRDELRRQGLQNPFGNGSREQTQLPGLGRIPEDQIIHDAHLRFDMFLDDAIEMDEFIEYLKEVRRKLEELEELEDLEEAPEATGGQDVQSTPPEATGGQDVRRPLSPSRESSPHEATGTQDDPIVVEWRSV